MTPTKGPPCSRGLDVDCFKEQPTWARQAFAARIINLLAPPQMSRKLQKFLRPALIAPGVIVPPGIDLPPGMVITPDVTFPPGWTIGDPLPPGVLADPSAYADVPPGGAAPPTYTAPWEPGPINQPGKQPAPSVAYWLYEPFADLATNSWSDLSFGGASATIVSETLKLLSLGGPTYAICRRTDARTWPTNETTAFSLKIVSCDQYVRLTITSGTYRIRITFTPPTTITVLPRVGSCEVDVANYLGAWHEYSLARVGDFSTLSMDGTPIISTCDTFKSGSDPGRMEWYQRGSGESYIDWLTMINTT